MQTLVFVFNYSSTTTFVFGIKCTIQETTVGVENYNVKQSQLNFFQTKTFTLTEFCFEVCIIFAHNFVKRRVRLVAEVSQMQ